MELLYRTNSLLEHERDQTLCPKNDYAPPFVSSLNFNFNMNDVFGSGKKTTPALPKSKSQIKFNIHLGTIESKSLSDVLGGIK